MKQIKGKKLLNDVSVPQPDVQICPHCHIWPHNFLTWFSCPPTFSRQCDVVETIWWRSNINRKTETNVHSVPWCNPRPATSECSKNTCLVNEERFGFQTINYIVNIYDIPQFIYLFIDLFNLHACTLTRVCVCVSLIG